MHKTCYYYLNYYSLEWAAAKMLSFRKLKNITPTGQKNPQGILMGEYSPQFLRDLWDGPQHIRIQNAGWHFGWCFGKELKQRIRYKMQCVGHQEFNNNKDIQRCVDNVDKLIDVRDRKITRIPKEKFGIFLPKYVLENLDYFIEKEMIK